MHARSWFVLTAICALVCTSGCGSTRWGNRHSQLRAPSSCVESSCDDPTCEICSPLPPLYDGMARSHRLNRRSMRGHGHHGRGRNSFGGGCSCGQCGGEWFDGEIIEGEMIGGDDSSGMSSEDGMMMDGGMGMSSGCSTCQQHVMSDSSMPHSSMMPGQSFQTHNEQQPTLANPQRSSVPSGGPAPPPSSSTIPGDMTPAPMGQPMSQPMGQPMGQPMTEPMTSMRTTNYGAALFGGAPAEPQPYIPTSTSQPIIHQQPMPMYEVVQPPSAPPAPPLASPAAHSAPILMAPPSMPTFPGEVPGAPRPSDFYSPKDIGLQPSLGQPNPIQLQSASIPAAQPGKRAMRPFSDSAKPRTRPAAQPQWEGTLEMQTVQPADASLPALPPGSTW